MNIADQIHELLKSHDCVVVPGLGGFIGHYQEARRKVLSSTMSPPSKRVAFNGALNKDDGVLKNYLVAENGLTYAEVNDELERFRKQVLFSLSQHGSFLLPGLGKLVRDKDGKTIFQPIIKENLLIESFGLPLVVAQPVKSAEVPVEAAAHPAADLVEVEEAPRVIPYTERSALFRAAAVIGMLFLTTTAIFSNLTGEVDYAQLTLIPVEFDAPEAVLAEAAAVALNAEDVHLYEAVSKPVRVEPTPTTFPDRSQKVFTDKYHVIVGSFRDMARMDREIDRMRRMGYTVETLPGPNGFTRVGLAFDRTTTTPVDMLSMVRINVNPEAWMP